MEIMPGIRTSLLGLVLVEAKVLIISDLHIGYEESAKSSGLMIPKSYFKEMYQMTQQILQNNKIDTIVINGDLKHNFGTIMKSEWSDTIRFIELFEGRKVVLIKGNHDVLTDHIAAKLHIKAQEYFVIGDILITHGDKEQDIGHIEMANGQKIKTIIIGHDHPAITLTSNSRKETFKCFLIGNTANKKRNLLVLPSYNSITIGSNVLDKELLSPYLQHDLSDFRVIISGDNEFDFGRIKELRKKFLE